MIFLALCLVVPPSSTAFDSSALYNGFSQRRESIRIGLTPEPSQGWVHLISRSGLPKMTRNRNSCSLSRTTLEWNTSRSRDGKTLQSSRSDFPPSIPPWCPSRYHTLDLANKVKIEER